MVRSDYSRFWVLSGLDQSVTIAPARPAGGYGGGPVHSLGVRLNRVHKGWSTLVVALLLVVVAPSSISVAAASPSGSWKLTTRHGSRHPKLSESLSAHEEQGQPASPQ